MFRGPFIVLICYHKGDALPCIWIFKLRLLQLCKQSKLYSVVGKFLLAGMLGKVWLQLENICDFQDSVSWFVIGKGLVSYWKRWSVNLSWLRKWLRKQTEMRSSSLVNYGFARRVKFCVSTVLTFFFSSEEKISPWSNSANLLCL